MQSASDSFTLHPAVNVSECVKTSTRLYSQFESIDRVHRELRDHTRNSTGSEFRPGMNDYWVIVPLELCEGALCGLLGLEKLFCDQRRMLTSYAPNLIADSGITLMTFKPLPDLLAKKKQYILVTNQHKGCACRQLAIAPSWPQQAAPKCVWRF